MKSLGGKALIAAALAVVAVLLGVQLAAGGADYRPAAVADPCAEPALPQRSADLDEVAQTIVILGAQRAACELGVSREALVLGLTAPKERAELLRTTGRDDRQLATALKQGLVETIAQLDEADRLPAASELAAAYAKGSGLPPAAADLLGNVPPQLAERYVPVGEILRKAVGGISDEEIAARLDDPAAFEQLITEAVTTVAIDEVGRRVSEDIPSELQDLLGLGG